MNALSQPASPPAIFPLAAAESASPWCKRGQEVREGMEFHPDLQKMTASFLLLFLIDG